VPDAYDVATIRALEAEAIAEVGEDTLMQRAASGVAAAVAREARSAQGKVYGTKIMILVGPGNNGGDALFAGARLARRGAAVTAVRCLGQPHARGLAALRAAGGRLIDLDDLDLVENYRAFDVAVDGILGIGGRPGLPDRLAPLAEALSTRLVPTVAVDLPSGVDADTGGVPGASVRADRTVTFGERKPCHLIEPARSRCGEIEVVDIGLSTSRMPSGGLRLHQMDDDELTGWPFPDARSDKYSRGVVGIDAGSDQYPGAGVLSTYGAVYGGAGMVRFLGADKPAEIIRRVLPNVVFSPGQVQSHLLGSGWGERPDGADIIATALDSGLPAVVDADGLKYLPEKVPARWLLTPHAGELARLLGEERTWVTDDPIRAVQAAVAKTGAAVLLKGATQLVAGPNLKWMSVALPGPAWTAQAGSGDVLGGLCAALLAAGLSAEDAGVRAASVQALTARRHPGPLPPQRLAELIADQIGALSERQSARLDEIRGTRL
jgi:ADP-dependent NAD(P)H-hydrate dehydratase / NAD(P)H-hydrate epimerase